jgi:hypothetical protein
MTESASAVDLETLKLEITGLAEKIKSLKAAEEPDKDAIATAVAALLTARRNYAANNDGLGVDGLPYEEPLTKAQKKAKAKTEKGAGPAKPVSKIDLA